MSKGRPPNCKIDHPKVLPQSCGQATVFNPLEVLVFLKSLKDLGYVADMVVKGRTWNIYFYKPSYKYG